MEADDLKVRHRAILAAHREQLDEDVQRGKPRISVEQFNVIRVDIQNFERECPDAAPRFDFRQVRLVPIGNQTKVELAPLRSHLARVIAALDVSMGSAPARPGTNVGFLSHAATDYDLANHLRLGLQQGAPGVEYFLASHRGHIPAGDSWCGPIFAHLRRADRFVILLTPASVGSRWVAFEAGAGWTGQPDHPLVVLCVGIEPKEVPTPFAELQLLLLDGVRGRDALLAAFERLGSRPPDDVEGFLAKARVLADACGIEGLREQGWTGERVADRFFAWAGPLDDLSDQPGVRLVKSELEALLEMLRCKGLAPAFVARDRLGSADGRQVFSVSPKGWKRAILGEEDRMVLVARST